VGGKLVSMTVWTTEELEAIGSAEELQIASRRADGTLRPFVTIWVVRSGDDIFVRSAYGHDNGWYRRAEKSGSGQIRAGGVERDVVFEDAAPNTTDAVDAAYHSKYDRYGARIVGTVVSDDARGSTLRISPQN
jgi:hypothetical protein